MGTIITPEFWQILLVVVTIVSVWTKTRDERVKTRMRIEADESAARIKQIEADVDIRLQQAKDDTEERVFQREQLKQQIKVNEGLQLRNAEFFKILQEKEIRDEGNYRTLSATQRDSTISLTNLYQDKTSHLEQMIVQWNQAAVIQRDFIQEQMKAFSQQLESVLTAIPALGSEIGMTLARQLAIQNLDRELIRFPADDDPRWKEVFLTPTKPSVFISKMPLFGDHMHVQKPCAEIKAEGHWVRVITNQVNGWLVVRKENGETCYGYLPEHAVKIHETEPAKALPG